MLTVAHKSYVLRRFSMDLPSHTWTACPFSTSPAVNRRQVDVRCSAVAAAALSLPISSHPPFLLATPCLSCRLRGNVVPISASVAFRRSVEASRQHLLPRWLRATAAEWWMIGRLANGFYEGFFFVGWLDGLVFSSPTQFCGASVTILIGPPGIYYIYTLYIERHRYLVARNVLGRFVVNVTRIFGGRKKRPLLWLVTTCFPREIDAKW